MLVDPWVRPLRIDLLNVLFVKLVEVYFRSFRLEHCVVRFLLDLLHNFEIVGVVRVISVWGLPEISGVAWGPGAGHRRSSTIVRGRGRVPASWGHP